MLIRNRLVGLVLIAVLLLTVAPAVFAAYTPDVFTVDQIMVDNTVNITRATLNEPGWLAIHADQDGAPGPVIGYVAMPAGLSANVKVSVDPEGVTEVLHAMLHVDKGEAGTFEFPDGPDVPVTRDGATVMVAFEVTDSVSTVVNTILESDQFTTLAAAIEAAGLGDALRKESSVTIFAPTDEAFASMPEEQLDALLADPEQLSQVLQFHVVPGVAVMVADAVDGDVESLLGAPLTLAVENGTVTVNGAPVTDADIAAYNGVIHAIDQVLLPPAGEEATAAAEEETAVAGEAPAADLVDIVATAANAGVFETLLQAAEAAGLSETLEGDGPFTVFAPTDDAFAALPTGTLDALLDDPARLAEVLQYHVLSGAVPAADIVDGMGATTLQGAPLTFALTNGSVTVNDARVITPDLLASNGILHAIDKVLLPPASSATIPPAATPTPDGQTLAALATEAGNFTTLLAAIDAAGLSESLAGAGPFTVFAPSDDAFAKLPAGTLDALLQDNQALTDLLLYHVVLDELTLEELVSEGLATTAQGGLLAFKTLGDEVRVNDAAIVQPDLVAGNGILHGIDSVLIPAAKPAGAAETEAAVSGTEEAAVVAAATEAAPTATATAVPTPVPTATSTSTPVPTATNTPLPTATATNTPVPTATATNTPLPTATATNTPVPTATATNTPLPTATATNTPVPTATATNTPLPTATATNTPVPTATATNTPLPTATATNTPVPTATATDTPLPTATATNTPVPTATATNTPLPTATATNTPVPTATATNTPLPTATATNTPVPTATATNTPLPTATATNTPVPTATATNTPLPTATATNTPVPTATATNTPLPTATATNTPVPTATATNTPLPTATATNTPVPTATATHTPLPTATATNTPVPTATATNTPLPTATATNTPLPTATATPETVEAATTEEAAAAAAATGEAMGTPEATVTGEATVEVSAEAAATGEATEAMGTPEATVTGEATVEVSAEAAATGEATEAMGTPEATVTGEATAEAEATAEQAAVAEPTETETPEAMPQSGGDFTSGGTTMPVVALVLAGLAAGAFVTRRRSA